MHYNVCERSSSGTNLGTILAYAWRNRRISPEILNRIQVLLAEFRNPRFVNSGKET